MASASGLVTDLVISSDVVRESDSEIDSTAAVAICSDMVVVSDSDLVTDLVIASDVVRESDSDLVTDLVIASDVVTESDSDIDLLVVI